MTPAASWAVVGSLVGFWGLVIYYWHHEPQ